MNPGKPFHRRHVQGIADKWREQLCTVFVEHQVVKDCTKSFMDAFVDLQGYKIGIEVEMSTRYVLTNATKALAVGCDEVHLVFPTAGLRDAARKKLAAHLSEEKMNRIAFLLLTPYQAAIYRQKNEFLTGKSTTQKSKKRKNEENWELA